MRETPDDDSLSFDAREAFALLGHEIRLDILLALLERWRAALTEPQSYSELMRAVEMQDSGKFNYHLDRLRGVYVRKVEDGYVPTASATALYRAILATRPTETSDRRSIEVSDSCPSCDGPLQAIYEGDFLTVDCAACGETASGFTYPFPANGLDGRTDEEVIDAVRRRAEHHVELARSGQCPYCAGQTTVSVSPEETPPVEMACETCSFVVGMEFLLALKRVPRVSAALLDLGIDMDSYLWWDLPSPIATVEDSDSSRIELELERDGHRATITVTDELGVESVTVDGEPVGFTD